MKWHLILPLHWRSGVGKLDWGNCLSIRRKKDRSYRLSLQVVS